MPTNPTKAACEPEMRSAVPGIVWPAIGSDASAHLQSLLFQLGHSQWLPAECIRERQLDQLKHLLRHATTSVPHYAGTFRGIDIDRLDWAAFQSLPLLRRKELQTGFDALKSTSIPASHGEVVEGRTSGSTGTPVRFLQTAVSQLFWNALTLREHLWHKRDFSGKLAAIRVKVDEGRWPDWGAPVAMLFNTGSGATLNVRTDVEKQLDWLISENPDYLITHASNLGVLAELTLRRGVQLPKLRQARTYSEALRPDLRDTVRKAWGVEVADVYSGEEAGYIALQCPICEHYHVQSENLLVEILDESGRPCEPGEIGRVVITPLHNFAMPLIRYEIDDYAEVGNSCPCGRGLPVLTRIHGRRRNMIMLPDGRRHWPSFPVIRYSGIAPICQIRIIQRTLTRIEAIYTAERPLSAGEKQGMVKAIQEALGYPFEVDMLMVEDIPRPANMKIEDIVSDVAVARFGG